MVTCLPACTVFACLFYIHRYMRVCECPCTQAGEDAQESISDRGRCIYYTVVTCGQGIILRPSCARICGVQIERLNAEANELSGRREMARMEIERLHGILKLYNVPF